PGAANWLSRSEGSRDLCGMHNQQFRSRLLLILASLGACFPVELDPFESSTTEGAGVTSAGGSTADPPLTSAGTSADLTTTTGEESPLCAGPVLDCADDLDGDQVSAMCDNAPGVFNPDQAD